MPLVHRSIVAAVASAVLALAIAALPGLWARPAPTTPVLAQDAGALPPRWRFPAAVSDPTGARQQLSADLFVDETGALHAVWVERAPEAPPARGEAGAPNPDALSVLRYASRPPGAIAWRPSVFVAQGALDQPVLTLDSDGALHVLFVGTLHGRAAIKHVIRRPGAVSFSAEAYVDASPAPQWSPALVADPWGRVHAAWTDLRGADTDLRHAMRYPDGRWSASTVLHNTGVGGDQRDVALTLNRTGDIHALWRDTRFGRSAIYAARLPAGSDIGRGDVWWPDESLARTAGGLQREPRLAADGTGALVAAWIDEAEGGTVRVATRAADDALWSLDRIRYRPSRGPLLSLALAAGGGRAYVAWGEGRSSGARLYGGWFDASEFDTPLRLDRAPTLLDARRPVLGLDNLGPVHAIWDTRQDDLRLAVHSELPQPPVSRTVITVAGWLTYVPRLHNCHGEGYQLVTCDGSPGLVITSRQHDLTSLLGGYVEIDGEKMGEGSCRRLEVRAARVKRAPCPRDTASVTGVLADANGPVEGAEVILGPVSARTGPSGRFFMDRLPEGRYPLSATIGCALVMDAGLQPLRPGQRLQLPSATFVRGDTNGDCRIDAGDLAAVGARYRQRPPRDLPCADVDHDGGVDLDDLAIVSEHLELNCPQPWVP